MRILRNWNSCCGNGPAPSVPSPTPPWNRARVSAIPNTIAGDGTISLVADTTYLDCINPKDANDPTVPYEVVLPNGNGPRQIIRIYIPQPNVQGQNTALFKVSGTFVGFGFLIFNKTTFNAVLEWDGAGWHMIGGNAEQQT